MKNAQKEIEVLQVGLDKDSQPIVSQPGTYIHAKNVTIEDTSGNGLPRIQNDSSNLEYYKVGKNKVVVGEKFIPSINKTLLMLVDHETGVSEIGLVEGENVELLEVDTTESFCCSGTTVDIEEDPLRLTSDTKYTQVLEDSCNKCLNFSIDKPFKKDNIVIKEEPGRTSIYFTNGYDELRYFILEDALIPKDRWQENPYLHTGVVVCNDQTQLTETCLDCTKLKFNPEYKIPDINVSVITGGGTVANGTYDIEICYSDIEGTVLSDYFTYTDSIKIFDESKVYDNPTQIGVLSTDGIKIDITNLDNRFKYYKVVLISRSGPQMTRSINEVGTYPITQESVYISDTPSPATNTVSSSDILVKKKQVDTADHMMSSNGYLFLGGIREPRVINLQPISLMLGAFMKWQSGIAKNTLYKDGASCAKYGSYMRKEGYAHSICFQYSDGRESNDFILAGRNAFTADNLQDLGITSIPYSGGERHKMVSVDVGGVPTNLTGDRNISSFVKFSDRVTDNQRTEYWQYFDTSTNEGTPSGRKIDTEILYDYNSQTGIYTPIGQDVKRRKAIRESIIEDMDGINIGHDILIRVPGEVQAQGSDLVMFLNNNKNKYLDPAYEYYSSELADYLNIYRYSAYNKIPIVTVNWKNPVLVPIEGNTQGKTIVRQTSYNKDTDVTNVMRSVYEYIDTTYVEVSSVGLDSYYDYNFNRLYIKKGFDGLYARAPRNKATTCNNAENIIIYQNTDLSVKEGYTFPNYGNRNSTGISGVELPNSPLSVGKKYPAIKLTPKSIDAGGNSRIDGTHVREAVETWAYTVCKQEFTNKISKNALWLNATEIDKYPYIQINTMSQDVEKLLGDAGDLLGDEEALDPTKDVALNRSGEFRVTIYDNCTSTAPLSVTFYNSSKGHLINLRTLGVSSNTCIIVIDTPLQKIEQKTIKFTRYYEDGYKYLQDGEPAPEQYRPVWRINNPDGSYYFVFPNVSDKGNPQKDAGYFPNPSESKEWAWDERRDSFSEIDEKTFTTTSTPASYMVTQRGSELLYSTILVRDLEIIKQQKWEFDVFSKNITPQIVGVTPYEEGRFGYIESVNTYPDNKYLFDANQLNITESAVDEKLLSRYGGDFNIFDTQGGSFKEIFKMNFGNENSFVDVSKIDFTCKPIRHFKYPSNQKTSFISQDNEGGMSDTFIFPLGYKLDSRVVNIFLDLAVGKLLTQEERDNIVSFKIKRSDRFGEETVLAKGLLTDILSYNDTDGMNYFGNFPYNDLGEKTFITAANNRKIKHPYQGKQNNKFLFNSPEIDYGRTFNPTEVFVEGVQTGSFSRRIGQIEEAQKMVIVTRQGLNLAHTLGAAESAFEFTSQIADLTIQALGAGGGGDLLGIQGGISKAAALAVVATVGILRATTVSNRTAELRNKWVQIFKDSGIGYNFNYNITSLGEYKSFYQGTNTNSIIRKLSKSTVVTSGMINILDVDSGGTLKLNHLDREKSLYLTTGSNINRDSLVYPDILEGYDDSSKELSIQSDNSEDNGLIANLYVTLGAYNPNQYKDLGSINWVDSTKYQSLKEDVNQEISFGGDIYISKYSYRKKFPYFLTNTLKLTSDTSIKYSRAFNIGKVKYYVDYNSEELRKGASEVTYVGSITNLQNIEEGGKYVTGGRFFHYEFSNPVFYVESTINNWFRGQGKDFESSFYPKTMDFTTPLQKLSNLDKDYNRFVYNDVYSMPTFLKPGRFINYKDYNPIKSLAEAYRPNTVIYSNQDTLLRGSTDPWLVFKHLNQYEFPPKNGRLTKLVGIESDLVLGIFENKSSIFNALDVLRERQGVTNVGNGGIFAQRPQDYYSSEVGFGGSQHSIVQSTEFGHFILDAKRGDITCIEPNGKGQQLVTAGLRNWFKENLPFKILRGQIEGLTEVDLDNPLKGLGISMGWDNRHKRLFVTKLDYLVKPAYRGKLEYSNKVEGETVIESFLRNRPKVIRLKKEGENPAIPVSFSNTDIFEPVYFTVSYSPLFKAWISYHDFFPNQYISYSNNFKTVFNKFDGTETTMWIHNHTNKSYGVYQNEHKGWEVEFIFKDKFNNRVLNNIEYKLTSHVYSGGYDVTNTGNKGFTRAVVYNDMSNSGYLNLHTKEPHNRFQWTKYPKTNINSTDILVNNSDNTWSFNDFYNLISERSYNNSRMWYYEPNNVDKYLNTNALNFRTQWKDRIRGDYFIVRLESRQPRRYKQIFNWVQSDNNYII